MHNKVQDEKMDTKKKILKVAAHIINTEGVFSLTLEAVAKEAGISKGGLLYHFPSKDALIQSMNDFLLNEYVYKLSNAASSDTQQRGKWTRAYVIETFKQLDNEYEMNAAFLAAAAINPKLFESMKEEFQRLQSLIENDQINPIISTIVKLAVDGLYFNEIFGQMELQRDLREKVLNYLILLTQEENIK